MFADAAATVFTGQAKLSRYVVAHDDGNTAFLWSTRSGRTVEIPSVSWQRFTAGVAPPQIGSLADRLKRAGILVPDGEDEKAVVLTENADAVRDDTELDLVLLPSANCPLGCNLTKFGGYCGQTHIRESLRDEGSQHVVEFVVRSIKPQHRTLRITWFGAEPLLALSRMREMTPALMRAAKERGLSYISTLVTGGTLLSRAVARECLQMLGIRSVSVTLDGVSAAHDERRPTKGGHPTFERIIRNLDTIIEDLSLDPLRISLRCNVDTRNADAPSQLINLLVSKDWHRRVDIYFAPVHPWGEHTNDSALSGARFAKLEIQWHRQQIAAGFSPVLIPPRKPIVCRVVSPSRLVAAHDGKLHRCTESPLTPVNAESDDLGDAKSWGEASEVPTWPWHDDLERGAFPCSDCVYLPCCGGTCPLSWRSGSDIPCPPFKYNGPERLALLRAKIMQTPAPSTESHHPRSILGVMASIAASGAESSRVSELDAELRAKRSVSSDEEMLCNAQALERPGQSSWTDWRQQKLEKAARISSAAYLYYRIGDLERVAVATEQAITCLHPIRMSGEPDVRMAQVQLLLNLLAAQYKVQHQFDRMLAEALRSYLDGKSALRMGIVIIPRLSSSESHSEMANALRESLLSIAGHGRVVPQCI